MRPIFLLTLPFITLLAASASAATGDVLLSYPSSFSSPDGLMWDGTYLWATDCGTSRIDKVDPATGLVVGSINVIGVNSDELAWDGTSMWMSDHTATEMPGMGAPPPRIYRVDPTTAVVLDDFAPPGQQQYPMGLAWDGETLWVVDPWAGLIFQLDPATGEVLRSIPAPASGACGMTWDGACLWVSSASTDGLIYHVDPDDGEVIRTFDGPGGPGHQATGVAWDGKHLWIHDEAVGRAKIHQVEVEDITENGRCAGAYQSGGGGSAAPEGGAGGGGGVASEPPSDDAVDSGCSGCTVGAGGTMHGLLAALLAGALSTIAAARRRRR